MTESVRGKRWRLRPEASLGDLERPELPRLIARLLAQRGVVTSSEAKQFLTCRLTPPDATTLSGMEEALARVQTALRDAETIAIYGDYDADGITATAILVTGLRELGAKVFGFLPNRFHDGYGLSRSGLGAVRRDDATLVITVDCGITAGPEVDYAAELGMDVVVLDHHEPPRELPHAAALVDPKLGGGPPELDHLSACGLAFTFLRTLFLTVGRDFDERPYLEFAAIGTVADMVPLRGENRRIVRTGLESMRTTRWVGLRALLNSAGVDAAAITTADIGFRIAPRINAAGRLDDARLALELLTTNEPAKALVLASQLNDLNLRRQRLTDEALQLARRIELEQRNGTPLVMVGHEEMNQGVVGLVAGRLVEELYRPAVVFERGPEVCKASVRGIPEFNVVECLAAGGELMERWGGHAQAGGFTVRNERLDELRQVLAAWTKERLAGVDLRPTLDIDLETRLCDLSGNNLNWLRYLEPCGMDNPHPRFLTRGVRVVSARPMGADGRHFKANIKEDRVTWTAKAFGYGQAIPRAGDIIDVVYEVSPSKMGGHLELLLLDYAPSR